MPRRFLVLSSLVLALSGGALAQATAPLPELTLELHPELGRPSLAGIRLVQRGCWDGLLGVAPRSMPPRRRSLAEATVEVWDWSLPEAGRGATFSVYLDTLRQRLSRALEVPPPGHAALELNDLMHSDPGNPQKLDLTRVKSMQDRFNRLPPNGSPVR